MTLEECNKYFPISLYYNDGLWYWRLANTDYKSKEGWFNPNNAKLNLIDFLKYELPSLLNTSSTY